MTATTTTIKVPRSLRDRLRARAVADGVTMAEEIERLLDERVDRVKPTVGGFSSGGSLTAEQIDETLASGFGR